MKYLFLFLSFCSLLNAQSLFAQQIQTSACGSNEAQIMFCNHAREVSQDFKQPMLRLDPSVKMGVLIRAAKLREEWRSNTCGSASFREAASSACALLQTYSSLVNAGIPKADGSIYSSESLRIEVLTSIKKLLQECESAGLIESEEVKH